MSIKLKIVNNISSDLILLYSRNYNGVLMTQQAFNHVFRRMDCVDMESHKKAYIPPSIAADLYDEVVVLEDLMEDSTFL